jgi:hypothetical protein
MEVPSTQKCLPDLGFMTYINLFQQLLRETESIVTSDGRHFPDRKLSHHLLCQCLEQLLTKDRINLFKRLTHFIAAAHRHKIDIKNLFFLYPVINSNLYREFCKDKTSSEYFDPLTVSYAEGASFTLKKASLALFVITGNIIAELLGFTEFIRKSERIVAAGDSFDRVEDIAIEWAKEFDIYRQKRGGSSQQERQYRAIVDFLARQFTAGEFTHLDIRSQHVLDFWSAHWPQKNLSVQRYKKVHDLFCNFVKQFAIEGFSSGKFTSSQHQRTSADVLADTYDILDSFSADHTTPYLSSFEDWRALLIDHTDVKFLDRTRLGDVSFLADLSPDLNNLYLSAMRSRCFAGVENKLIQLRRNCASRDQLAEALDPENLQGSALDYKAIENFYIGATDSFREVGFACAYVLLYNQCSEALWLLYHLDPDLDGEDGFFRDVAAAGLLPDSEKIDATQLEEISELFFTRLIESHATPPHIQKSVKNAHSIWKKINRQGFIHAQINDTSIVESLTFAAPRIPNALSHLESSLRQLYLQVNDLEQKMQEDRLVMHQIFSDIYLSVRHSEEVV